MLQIASILATADFNNADIVVRASPNINQAEG
jgi:hypothetical protein